MNKDKLLTSSENNIINYYVHV